MAAHGIPEKVLAKARVLGVHNDCLVAGVEGCCPDCFLALDTAFDFFYGDLSKNEKLGAILADLMMEAFDDGS